MPRIKLIDGVEVQYTAEEEAQADKDEAEAVVERNDMISKATQKATDSKNANDKLIGLGLTQAEVTAITGYKLPEEL
jgi:predicted HAD superfamily Cof-like phosphohydrolase